ncbi:MAG: TrkA family potassium uptake protein [Chloroflexota bacterium]|nr:TrkA family potassium uptake protein [Chloroflexota bacterium]MDE2895454.1 TrkA family potassium uptake protein [Chloroflexota bacterium]
MYIIIVGGGKVGRGAARDLMDMGHEVCVVERDGNTAWAINNELGEVALLGDGAEIHVQRAAGMNRADVVVACTGRDQANLAVAQTAQTRFNVAKVIARINDPRNEPIFQTLGFHYTISATTAIVSAIEQEVSAGLNRLTQMRSTAFILAEHTIPSLAPCVGCTVRDLDLPPHTVLALIVHKDDEPEIPGPNTTIHAGDVIVAVTQPEHESSLRLALTGDN